MTKLNALPWLSNLHSQKFEHQSGPEKKYDVNIVWLGFPTTKSRFPLSGLISSKLIRNECSLFWIKRNEHPVLPGIGHQSWGEKRSSVKIFIFYCYLPNLKNKYKINLDKTSL